MYKRQGKPGEPINPNDPNGPKWPSDTDTKGLTKQGNQTIHYVYVDGNKAADDNVQNVTFVHTLVFDNVTGQVIDDRAVSYTHLKVPITGLFCFLASFAARHETGKGVST